MTITPVAYRPVGLRVWGMRAAAQLLTIAVVIFADAERPTHAEAPKKKPPAKNEEVAPARPPLIEQQLTGTIAAQYCESVRDIAADARFAQQQAQLEELGKKIDGKASELEARSAQLKEWVQKREAFVQKATEQLVQIYTGMKAEAASEQLARLDPATAASIVMRLDTRVASAILNEMAADKAASLSTIVAASAQTADQAVKP